MSLVALIPAAGRSSRMRGRNKLTEIVDGWPLLLRQVAEARAAHLPVRVTVRWNDLPTRSMLRDLPDAGIVQVPVRDASEGMAASLRAGVAALPPEAQAVMVMLPDMPGITRRELAPMQAAQAAAPNRIIQATTEDGRPGHPVIFPRRLFAAFARLSGDIGARRILAQETPHFVALRGDCAVTDLDTPEAWAAWRADRG